MYYENYMIIEMPIPDFEEIKKKCFDNEESKIVLLNDKSPFEYFTPVMYSDGSGCYSTPTDWINAPNLFGLTSTVAQLLINGASIYSYYRIANAFRPQNIGLGIWNSGQKAALESFNNVDVPKFKKASTILGVITVGLQVLSAGVADYNRNYSTDRIVSNAIVNTAIYSVTTIGYAYIGGFIGSFIPVPIVGTAVGTVVGYIVGFGMDLFLEWEIDGKSIIDYARDWVYNTWSGWFK